MSMSKKDYVEIAGVLNNLYSQPSASVDRGQVAMVADALADRFALLNPRFDREKFLAYALADRSKAYEALGFGVDE